MTTISSEVKPNYQLIPPAPIEAWLYNGQKFAEWPDWIRSKMEATYGVGNVPKPPRHAYALRDEEGYFWRWMDKEKFERQYEPFEPLFR